MGENLKPCPFCGAQWARTYRDGVMRLTHDDGCYLASGGAQWIAAADDVEFVEAWNRRERGMCTMRLARVVDGEYGSFMMRTCSVCGGTTRSKGNYCQWCGSEISGYEGE